MGRSEKPVDPQAPYAAFARQLRKLRDSAGSPTYGTLARKTGYSVAALSQAASGWKLPSWKLTRAYATCCGGSEQHWQEQWMIARQGDLADFVGAGAWSTRPPSPSAAARAIDFLNCLRALKIWAGDPSYAVLAQEMFQRQDFWSAKSTVASALAPSRTRLPGLDLVLEIVQGFLSLGRPGESVSDSYLMEWRQAWVRLATAERAAVQAVDAAPVDVKEVGQVRSSALVAPLHTPDGTVRHLRPVDGDLPRELQVLAYELRRLFDSLQISTRRYAVRRHMDASTLSRYLSGRRMPPWSFVQALLDDTAENVGQLPSTDVVPRVRSLYTEALASAKPEAYRVALLEREVSSLQARLATALQELDAFRRPA